MSAEVIQINSGERVKADTDDGYFKLANQLMDALCSIDLNGRQFRLVNAVMRLTYGWKRPQVAFNREELSGLTGIKLDEVSRIKNALVKCCILIEDGKEIGLNPFISDWSAPLKRTSKTVHSHSKTVQLHRKVKSKNCAIAQEKLGNCTGKTVHSHSKSAPWPNSNCERLRSYSGCCLANAKGKKSRLCLPKFQWAVGGF